MSVTLVGYTVAMPGNMETATEDEYQVWADGNAADLIEFAGRACYRSWNRPNPATSTTPRYVQHLMDVGHLSVLEHGTVSLYITDVSRSFTHELVRHRHLSFSQLSQRYVSIDKMEDEGYITPPLFDDDAEAETILTGAWIRAVADYRALINRAEKLLAGHPAVGRGDVTLVRKQAREAARAVLPNMTPTAIVVTGNHRTWREFLQKRATIHADAEMCEVAVDVFGVLKLTEPILYQDAKIESIDGRPVLIGWTDVLE